jgi:hypothetical protein
MRAVATALLLTSLIGAAAAQTAAPGPDRAASGAVSLPPQTAGAAVAPAPTQAAAANAAGGTGGSGARAGTAASAAPAAVGGGSGVGAGAAPSWVLCPPPGAPGIAPLFAGTDLSCAP